MFATVEIHPGITRISSNFDAILLDAYGVFWSGNEIGLFPEAKEAMEQLVLNGKIVGILSNSTFLASKEISKLEKHGLTQGKHFHFLVTSGEAVKCFLNEKLPFETPRNKFILTGKTHPKFSTHEILFHGTIYSETKEIDEADFIYVSTPHIDGENQIDPDLFRKDIEKLRSKNLPMICPNPDKFAHEGTPPKAVVRQGSIAIMYEEMGGRVFYIGKPYKRVYDIVMTYFEQYNIIDPEKILMVGDTPETDIRGAKSYKMHSALITNTGIMADRIQRIGFDNALKEINSSDIPDYYIERLVYDIHSSS